MVNFRLIVVLMLLVCEVSPSNSQAIRPSDSNRGSNSSFVADSVTEKPALIYQYVYSGDPLVVHEFSDTSLNNGFMFVDPSRKAKNEYIHLGYPGSSAFPLSSITYSSPGFNTGYHNYDIYKQDIDSLRFYKTNRTIADLSFYQLSGNQNNLNANADYSQNFKDDISLSVNFKRYGFESQYKNLSNQSTSFAIGLTYNPTAKPYKSYIAFLSNANNETMNGGIVNYLELNGPFASFRENATVALNEAQNRHEEKTLKWNVSRTIFSDKIVGTYDLSYKWNRYFYYDSGLLDANDSTVYKGYITDDRGLRYNVNTRTLSNGGYLDATFFSILKLNVGLVYDRIAIDYGVREQTRNDLSLVYKGLLSPTKSIDIDVKGHFGLGSNIGNFLLDANSQFNWKSYFDISLGWKSYLNEPSMISSYVELNNTEVYRNDFTKILGTQLAAKIGSKKIGIYADVKQKIENNTIYWTRDAVPAQFNGVYSTTELGLNTSHKLWKFGIENRGVYQIIQNNLFNLPNWYTSHNVYFESRLFQRNLLLRLGTNARVIPSGQALAYQPVVGQFYQGDFNPTLFPEWSFYIAAKVSQFRLILEYDNMTSWFTDQVNFNIQDYPYNDPNLRFGIRWLLLD